MKGSYYTAPSDVVFQEMKRECVGQWQTHDNTYGYVDKKLAHIEYMQNFEDNFMYLFAMFDHEGQRAIVGRLSDGTREALRVRLLEGGNEPWYIRGLGL